MKSQLKRIYNKTKKKNTLQTNFKANVCGKKRLI